MGYCFMTTQKIKSFAKMEASYKHNLRIYQPINADPDKAVLNEELISLNGKSYRQAWNEIIENAYANGSMNKKIRSDAVLGLEVVMTFSREEFEKVDIEEWKKNNVKWLNQTFNAPGNTENNVVSAVYHGDENGNVHIHAFVVPMNDKGRLNAGYYVGGPGKCRKLQDDYGKFMESQHGLRRGLKNSVAKHEDIKKFYTKLNQSLDVSRVPQPEPDEEINQYYGRVCKFVQDASLSALQKEKEVERKFVEMQTAYNGELSSYRLEMVKNRKKEKRINELLGKAKKYGEIENISPNELEKKLKTFDALQNGLNHMKDQEYAQTLRNEINTIIKNEHNRQKSIQKEYDQYWDI